jgi:hypothetical protein
VAKAEVNSLLEVVEERDAFPYQLDLLDVVELEAKCPGCDGCGERRQCGAFFEDERPKSGTLGEKRGRAADDPTTDDDEIGALGR